MAASAHGPWRVLVVDDEENLNWSLVNSLRKEGYTADGALSGEEALRRLEAAPYDCVISDVKMPGMDGFELLQWLRQRRPGTRVIVMTAFGSPTARQDAARAGVIAYLEKPFDLAALKDELRRLFTGDEAATAAESEGYDLLEVARVLNLARRDIALAVQGGGASGTLRFVRGELFWAEAGALRGDAAFLALCTPQGGHAWPALWDGRSERNVTLPVSHLIYQALAARDARAANGTPASSDPVPSAATDAPNAADLATTASAAGATAEVPPAAAATFASEETLHLSVAPEIPDERDMPATEAAGAMDASDASSANATMASTPAAEESPPTVDAGHEPPPPDLPAEPVMPVTTVLADTLPMTPGAPAMSATPASPTAPTPVAWTFPAISPTAPVTSFAEPVEALARALGLPCGVVLVRSDGTVLAQRWLGMRALPAGAFVHLAGAAQAAARALLLADLGSLDDAVIRAGEHALLLCRVAHGDRAVLLVALLPAEAASPAAAATLRSYAETLEPALR